MLFANVDDGYLEGMLRGYRGGILTSSDYANLCQCESIDGETACRPVCTGEATGVTRRRADTRRRYEDASSGHRLRQLSPERALSYLHHDSC